MCTRGLNLPRAGPHNLVDGRVNPLGFPQLWFKPCSGHMWESQVLLTDGQVVFPRFLGFRPPLMNNQLNISDIFLTYS